MRTRERLGELKLGQSKVSLFHVDGKGVQVILSKPGKLLVEGYYPDLEEVLMALFVETNKPKKVSSKGRAYFLVTDFDAFLLKNFPALNPTTVRKNAGEKGITLVPRSFRKSRAGCWYVPTHFIDVDYKGASVRTLVFPVQFFSKWNEIEKSLNLFSFEELPLRALKGIIHILLDKDHSPEDVLYAQKFMKMGPYANEKNFLFMMFKDNRIISKEPDITTFIIPKKHYVFIQNEYLEDVLNPVLEVREQKKIYGYIKKDKVYAMDDNFRFFLLDTKDLDDYDLIEPKTWEGFDKFKDYVLSVRAVSEDFIPCLYSFYLSGGALNVWLHSLQDSGTSVWRQTGGSKAVSKATSPA